MRKKKDGPGKRANLRLATKQQTQRHTEGSYQSLLEIGIALSAEHDLNVLFDLVLDNAIRNTNADAASIYLVEQLRIDSIANTDRKFFPILRLCRSRNVSNEQPPLDLILNLDSNSIASYVATTGHTVRIDDCYQLSEDAPYKFNQEVDKELGYHTRSMLAIPLRVSDGRVRGVLQLINKHSSEASRPLQPKDIVDFTQEDEDLMLVFASQAAIAIENGKLTDDIERLFESFIRASVTAVESRDLATAGHSDRVAVLSVELARAIHHWNQSPFQDTKFTEQQIRELRYAALLHDFGKIGVSESLLMKATKLRPQEREAIRLRLGLALEKYELKIWRNLAYELPALISQNRDSEADALYLAANEKIAHFHSRLKKVETLLEAADQPTSGAPNLELPSLIKWMNDISFEVDLPLLSVEELRRLAIVEGTIDPQEREEIESHVEHTYDFLKHIAWTDDLVGVPEIAYCHHERCDGSGYPRNLEQAHISLQSRIIAIADMYDALTNTGKTYSRPISPARALKVMDEEAKKGYLDPDLLRVFIETSVFRSIEGMRDMGKAS